MNNEETIQTLESNVRSYSRVFPAVFSKAKDEIIYDLQGKKYLDFFSGAGALNYGHNNTILKEKLIDYLKDDGITHSLDMYTKAKSGFLNSFDENILKRRNLEYFFQFTGPTGANAVEASIKLARKIKGRSQIISFTNGYHGVTLGALATTSNSYHRKAAGVQLYGSYKIPYDGYLGNDFDSMDYLKKVLRDSSSGFDLPAAILVETIQGEGGINVASFNWLKKLENLCNEFDILLIVDDIQAGCGRTGTFFSFEEAGIYPDMITMSKSLSGFGLPFSLLLLKPEIDAWKPGEHNGTFRGNNLAFIAAQAAIDHYWCNYNFQEEIKDKGNYIDNQLSHIVEKNHSILSYSGRGMFYGLKCNSGTISKKISAKCFEKGLLLETCGSDDEVLKIMAPLTIKKEQLERGFDILKDTIK